MYQPINMSPDVQKLLPGVRVIGCRTTLALRSPSDYIVRAEDWRRLHRIWRGKTKAEVAAEPRIAAYIDLYKQMGLNPKKNPPSIQNLIKRFLIRDTLERYPVIHPIVDAVNVAAVESLTPMGVFDAETVEGDLLLALTEGGELFRPIGAESSMVLSPGVLVLRDDVKVLSQFGYRDGDAQKVTSATSSVWLLGVQVPGIEDSSVEQALDRALELIERTYTRREAA